MDSFGGNLLALAVFGVIKGIPHLFTSNMINMKLLKRQTATKILYGSFKYFLKALSTADTVVVLRDSKTKRSPLCSKHCSADTRLFKRRLQKSTRDTQR